MKKADRFSYVFPNIVYRLDIRLFKQNILFVTFLLISLASWGQTTTLTEKGAWCWFADPRAINYENPNGNINSTYIGYIDTHGNIKATQLDHLKNTTDEVLIRSYFQPDDHNNPTFLVLPDERIMIFYSRHTDESCFYYRVSQKPGDITTLGREIRLETANNTTYPSPFILSGDPDHIYLCWRGIEWHPTIARLTMPDANDEVRFDWGPFQMVRSQNGARGVRPYAKYMSNGKDRIYMAYTTTHPDNQSVNYIYFNYIDINTKELKDIKGRKLATVGSSTLHNVEATADYKNKYPNAVVEDSSFRNWLWEISVSDEQHPAIAMVRINENKDSHDYYHVRWTGSKWQKTFLSNAGGYFHQTPNIEKCYSGGMSIDKADPGIMYASVPVDGKYGKVYELMKYTVATNGTLTSSEQLTFDSPKNNIRPYVISNKDNNLRLAWMYGDYYDWIVSSSHPSGYPTAIRTNMDLSTGDIDPEKGLLLQKHIGNVSPGKNDTISIPQATAFTVVMNLFVDHDTYYGQLLKTNTFTYNLEKGAHPKPDVRIGEDTYRSSNVLGNSDIWKTQNRGTGGHWYEPSKLGIFQLVITYADGIMRTYINGLHDQYIEAEGLSLSDIIVGGFRGVINDIKVYNRALSQNDIKQVRKQTLGSDEKDKSAYLFTYFSDPTHSLFMAVSRDGYTFTAVNDGQPIIAGDTIAEQRGIRDPHIYRGPDGAFYVAMTDLHIFGKQKGYRTTDWERDRDKFGWGNNRGFVLMKSYDLINWTRGNVNINESFPELDTVGCAWAPQTTYDPVAKKMMLYFTMRFGNGHTKLYYSYTNDDFTSLETVPRLLFEYPDPKIQILDADIIQLPDNRFCMTYVAQENPGGIKIAFSDSIHTGYKYQPEWIDFEPGACEAPNVWKRIGEDKWVLMYDIFSINPHNFGFCETSDFKTFRNLGHFNEGVMKITNAVSPKHGAVIQITNEEADRLENYWAGKK